jgi:iron complex outermembrane receptor protein
MCVIKARVGGVAAAFLAAAGVVAAEPARADVAAPSSETNGSTLALEEIIVTARKREENLQEVPISISAFTAEQLRANTIQEPTDLQYHTPGLTMRGGGGQRDSLDYFIRGQGTTFGGGPAVVTYFAGAPIAAQGAAGLGDNQQFYDLGSVQVLKGPQGTLFGRSTTGGAVLFEPTRPGNEFSGTVQISEGNLHYHEYQGFVNIPLIDDKLKIRIAGDSLRRDGFTRSLSTGQMQDNRNTDSFRVGLSFTPVRWFDNYLMFQNNKTDQTAGSVVLLKVNNTLPLYNPVPGLTPYGPTGGAIVGFLCQAFNPGNPAGAGACFSQRTAILAQLSSQLNAEAARVAAGGKDAVRSDQTSVNTQLQGHTQYLNDILSLSATDLPYVGDVTFRDIFATQKNYGVENLRELAGGSAVTHATVVTSADVINWVPTYTPTSTGENHWLDNFSEEAQLLGTVDGKHHWILGYYLEEHKFKVGDPAIFTVVGNVTSPVLTAPTIASQMVGDSLKIVRGYFGQFSVDLSDWVLHGLKFTAGYRWSQSYARSVNLKGGYDATGTIAPNVTPGGPCVCTASQPLPTLNDQAPSWNFGFDWQATDHLLTYIATRRGNKPGGVNILPPVLFPGLEATFAPETLTDVELGIKSDWTLGGHRGRTNADLYRQWYNNIQRTEFVPNPINPAAPVQQTANIAKAVIEGFELDSVMELTDHLSLSLTYAYIDPRYTQWPGVTAPGPGVVGGLPLVNSPFPGTPRHQGTLGLRYSIPLASAGELTAGADYYRQSSVQLNDQALADNNVVPPTPGYGNLNLRLDWANIFSKSIDADFFMRNATNDVHQISVNSLWSSFGFISAIYNEPRTWGVEARYRFGAAAH